MRDTKTAGNDLNKVSIKNDHNFSQDETPARRQKMMSELNFEKNPPVRDDAKEPVNDHPMYEHDQRVYASDEKGVDFYLATIKQIKISHKSGLTYWKYLVHFHGWNVRHDRWLSENEILSDNEESRKLAEQTRLRAEKAETIRKEKIATMEIEKKSKAEYQQGTSLSEVEGNRKRARPPPDNNLILCEQTALPFSLQQVLVEEQSELNRSQAKDCRGALIKHMHDLPASISVQQILKQFVKCQSQFGGICADISLASGNLSAGNRSNIGQKYKSFIDELTKLFDNILPKFLLYNFERGQYLKLSNSNAKGYSMTNVYSAEFLLRMLARLPHILSAFKTAHDTSCKENGNCTPSVPVLMLAQWRDTYNQEYLDVAALIRELIVFLQKNRNKIFKGKYISCL